MGSSDVVQELRRPRYVGEGDYDVQNPASASKSLLESDIADVVLDGLRQDVSVKEVTSRGEAVTATMHVPAVR